MSRTSNLSQSNAYVIRSSAWLSILLKWKWVRIYMYQDKYYASISREGFLFPERSIELRTVWFVYMYVFVCGRAAAGKKSLTRWLSRWSFLLKVFNVRQLLPSKRSTYSRQTTFLRCLRRKKAAERCKLFGSRIM